MKALPNSPTLKFRIELATPSDSQEILAVEKAAFGVSIHPEEMRQILEGGIGQVYIARDEVTNKIIGYQTVLFKNPDEEVLQPLLRASTLRYMHDDIHHIEVDKEAYLHLLGILPDYQGKGIGKALLQRAFYDLSQRFEKITSIIRINNLSSMYPVMKATGGYIESFQEKSNDPDFHGSKETNLNVVRNTKIDKTSNFETTSQTFVKTPFFSTGVMWIR